MVVQKKKVKKLKAPGLNLAAKRTKEEMIYSLNSFLTDMITIMTKDKKGKMSTAMYEFTDVPARLTWVSNAKKQPKKKTKSRRKSKTGVK